MYVVVIAPDEHKIPHACIQVKHRVHCISLHVHVHVCLYSHTNTQVLIPALLLSLTRPSMLF